MKAITARAAESSDESESPCCRGTGSELAAANVTLLEAKRVRRLRQDQTVTVARGPARGRPGAASESTERFTVTLAAVALRLAARARDWQSVTDSLAGRPG